MLESLINLDQELFLFLNSHHSPLWDEVMYQVSGRFIWIPLYAFILYLFVRKYKTRSIIPILGAVLLIVLADQLSNIIKDSCERLRPCREPDIKDHVHLVRDYCGKEYGFISNHAANTFALAVFSACIIRNKIYSCSIFIWAFWVSYSRIYLGVHYPGDVLAGALFGILLGILLYYLVLKIMKWVENKSINLKRSP